MPFAESEPSVRPWKPWSTESDPAALRRRAAELQCCLDRLGPGARELHALEPGGNAGEQRLGEQPRQRGRAELDGAGQLELERLDQRVANARVVPADVEHPEAAEHVEVAVAVGVPEVRALGALPRAVEVDRAQHAHELRVDRARPAFEVVASTVQQPTQVDAGHEQNVVVWLRLRAAARGTGRRARP